MAHVLRIRDLNTRFDTPEGEVAAVNDVSLHVDAGESLGIVGESGSGKSQVFMSALGLLAKNGRARGHVDFHGIDLLSSSNEELNRVRGARIGMIFQDPMTSLNPYLTVATQMTEVLVEHRGLDSEAARAAALRYLEMVEVPEAGKRLDQYPHEFSGGMRQRVMIAMALLCEPELLIADEPTTALDVTVQAAILEVLADVKRRLDTAIILITHDLGVVAGLCERVIVMYAGRVVEQGTVEEIFYAPQHPYTLALLNSMPRADRGAAQELQAIPGQPPNLQRLPPGCAYRERCPVAEARCIEVPALREIGAGRLKACHREQPA